jgi:hypothetical protein
VRIHVPATEGHPTFLAEEMFDVMVSVDVVSSEVAVAPATVIRQINPNSLGVTMPHVSRETVQAVLAELYRRHPNARVTTGTNRYNSREEFEAGSHG